MGLPWNEIIHPAMCISIKLLRAVIQSNNILLPDWKICTKKRKNDRSNCNWPTNSTMNGNSAAINCSTRWFRSRWPMLFAMAPTPCKLVRSPFIFCIWAEILRHLFRFRHRFFSSLLWWFLIPLPFGSETDFEARNAIIRTSLIWLLKDLQSMSLNEFIRIYW